MSEKMSIGDENRKALLDHDLLFAKKKVYDICGFDLTDAKINAESTEYAACSFRLNGHKTQYRNSKITPKKIGQFVAIWKRNTIGFTEPFADSDDIEFLIITSKSGDNFGQFIFPKHILVTKGIFTKNIKQGKRGIRLYPPWDRAPNKQAQQTQIWQTRFFLSIRSDDSTDIDSAKQLLSPERE